jgi:hypothetical protein
MYGMWALNELNNFALCWFMIRGVSRRETVAGK